MKTSEQWDEYFAGDYIDPDWVTKIRADLRTAEEGRRIAWDRMAVHNKDADDAVARAEAELAALKARCEGMRGALRIYGRHKKNCLWHEGMPDIDTPQRCTCGFEDALRGLFDAALVKEEED